jgi:NAD(P)-dependent dehydrogenase (short-subunit alcohol dehydrogenase family)
VQARRRAHTCIAVHVITYSHQSFYSSVNSIAQTAAWQLQRSDIRVNALCPGLIETAMTAPVFDRARQRGTADKLGQLNALGRYGVAEGTSLLYPFYSKR